MTLKNFTNIKDVVKELKTNGLLTYEEGFTFKGIRVFWSYDYTYLRMDPSTDKEYDTYVKFQHKLNTLGMDVILS